MNFCQFSKIQTFFELLKLRGPKPFEKEQKSQQLQCTLRDTAKSTATYDGVRLVMETDLS